MASRHRDYVFNRRVCSRAARAGTYICANGARLFRLLLCNALPMFKAAKRTCKLIYAESLSCLSMKKN